MYEETRKSIVQDGGVVAVDKFEDKVEPNQFIDEYQEAIDIFPALHKYKTEHNTLNLQKLCVEIKEFCRAVYASTQNEAERDIYRKVLKDI